MGDLGSREGAKARRMKEAPKDGTRILIWVRHSSWQYAPEDDRDQWEGWVIGSWTGFNGGGWTWHGHCGEFMGWLPLPEYRPLRAFAPSRETPSNVSTSLDTNGGAA